MHPCRSARKAWRRALPLHFTPQSLLREEILVEALQFDRPGRTNANTVFDHQVGEAVAVDEDDALGKMADEIGGRRAKA